MQSTLIVTRAERPEYVTVVTPDGRTLILNREMADSQLRKFGFAPPKDFGALCRLTEIGMAIIQVEGQ